MATMRANLWSEAYESLNENLKEKAHFPMHMGSNDEDAIPDILKIVEGKKQSCLDQRWQVKVAHGRVIVVRDVLDRIVKWIDKFKAVGDSAMNFDPVHAALPWAAIRFVLQVSVSEVKTFSDMIEGIEKVASLVTKCALFEDLYLLGDGGDVQQRFMNSMVNLYTAILIFLGRASRYYSQSTAKRIAKGLFASDFVEEQFLEMERLENEVYIAQRIIERETARNTGAHVKEVKDGVTSIRTTIAADREKAIELLSSFQEPVYRLAQQMDILQAKINEEAYVQRSKGIYKWLAPANYRDHHRVAASNLLPGSAAWFLDHLDFHKWKDSRGSNILWLHGIPGSGKTGVIASVIKNHLEKGGSHLEEPRLAYFYCSRSTHETSRSDPDIILRTLLLQLSRGVITMPDRKEVVRAYDLQEEEAKAIGCDTAAISFHETGSLMLQILEEVPAMIVIDALDECSRHLRPKLLQALTTILERPNLKSVKVLISSRDDQDIVCKLGLFPNVYISATDNHDDIARFTVEELDNAIQTGMFLRGQVSSELRQQIIDTLIAKAQAMFIWVKMSIQHLQLAKQESTVRRQLGKLPIGLAKLYELIYQSILEYLPEDKVTTQTLFGWMLCAQESATLELMVTAVRMGSLKGRRDLIESQILDLCCNLVVFDKILSEYRFVHLSVKEYLESRAEFSEEVINTVAVSRCIDLLQTPKERRTSDDLVLQHYASSYWPIHYLCSGQSQHAGSARERFEKFLLGNFGSQHKNQDSTWVEDLASSFTQLSPYYKIFAGAITDPPNLLFIACMIKSAWILQLTDQKLEVKWDQKNRIGGTPLHYAAGNQYLTSVLQSKRRPELISNSILQFNLMFISLFTSRGIDINIRDASGHTPLHWAARDGNVEMGRSLIAHGANIEAENNSWQTPIHLAALKGQTRFVKMLHSRHANLEPRDDRGYTPLHLSANSHQGEVCEFLVAQGVNPYVTEHDGSMLHWGHGVRSGPASRGMFDETGSDVYSGGYSTEQIIYD